MDRAAPKVSVVIPNRDGATPRNGLVYLELVMRTLGEQSFRDFDITVVDNGSSDDSLDYLRREWPQARTVEIGENAGFPVAANRGIEASSGEYIALINNDLELSDDWLERLVAELDRNPAAGFATGKIMRFRERGVLEQAGQDLYTCGRFAPRGIDQEDVGQYDRREEIAVASAAAVLYRRAAVERAGGFDPDYFLYCEDADLCLRMVLAGYSGIYVPDVAAFHVRGGTAEPDSDPTRFYVLRNPLVTLVKDFPGSLLWRAAPKILRYQAHQLRTARVHGYVGALFRAYGSFLGSLPRILRKRRQIHPSRAITAGEFESVLRSEYPPAEGDA